LVAHDIVVGEGVWGKCRFCWIGDRDFISDEIFGKIGLRRSGCPLTLFVAFLVGLFQHMIFNHPDVA
jgi:hypothetical protein